MMSQMPHFAQSLSNKKAQTYYCSRQRHLNFNVELPVLYPFTLSQIHKAFDGSPSLLRLDIKRWLNNLSEWK